MGNAYQRFRDALQYEEMVQSVYDSLIDRNVGSVFLHKVFIGKKSGYSHDIDVAIETSVASLDITILIECKHYKRSVEVGDVLAFAQRIDDIGAHKGVIVSTVGFQEGSRKVARAHGIALVVTEPIWQVIMPRRDGDGTITAFTTGGLIIGGESDKDTLLFRGVTAVTRNYTTNICLNCRDAWHGIIDCLLSESDPEQRDAFLKKTLEDQLSDVCPFCGEQLRTARSKQCESCLMDWHDPNNIVTRSVDVPCSAMDQNDVLGRLVAIIAKKLLIDEKFISPTTHIIEDLGADEIDFIELLLEIEEKFDIVFGDDFDERTSRLVANIYDYIQSKTRAAEANTGST